MLNVTLQPLEAKGLAVAQGTSKALFQPAVTVTIQVPDANGVAHSITFTTQSLAKCVDTDTEGSASSRTTASDKRLSGGADYLFDETQCIYQAAGWVTRFRPFRVSVAVKDTDILSPYETVGVGKEPIDLWLPTETDKEQALATLDCSGTAWVTVRPQHPAPPRQRGVAGKILLRWTVSKPLEEFEASFQALRDVVVHNEERSMQRLRRSEQEERNRIIQGSEEPPVSVYTPYRPTQHYNVFSHSRCHQTNRPFSELVQSRDNEFHSPGRKRATTSESQQRPSTNQSGASSLCSPRYDWSTRTLTGYTQASWVPSIEAKAAAQSRKNASHLRDEEQRRVREAAFSATVASSARSKPVSESSLAAPWSPAAKARQLHIRKLYANAARHAANDTATRTSRLEYFRQTTVHNSLS